MLTQEDLTQLGKMLNAGDDTFTDSQIALAAGQVDIAAIEAQASEYASASVWDGTSDVNGIPAEKMRARRDFVKDSAVYLVTIDGRVQIIQPYKPGVAGYQPMTEAEAQEIGNAVASGHAGQQRFFLLLDAVRGVLNGAVEQ